MLTSVASSSEGNSLDERVASQEVEDLPHGLGRVEEVAGEELALVVGLSALLDVRGVSEGKERNVAELELGEVGQHGISQLDSLLGDVCLGELLGGGGNSGLVGICKTWLAWLVMGSAEGDSVGEGSLPTVSPSTTSLWAPTKLASGMAAASNRALPREGILTRREFCLSKRIRDPCKLGASGMRRGTRKRVHDGRAPHL